MVARSDDLEKPMSMSLHEPAGLSGLVDPTSGSVAGLFERQRRNPRRRPPHPGGEAPAPGRDRGRRKPRPDDSQEPRCHVQARPLRNAPDPLIPLILPITVCRKAGNDATSSQRSPIITDDGKISVRLLLVRRQIFVVEGSVSREIARTKPISICIENDEKDSRNCWRV
jgi:hypothetical protein